MNRGYENDGLAACQRLQDCSCSSQRSVGVRLMWLIPRLLLLLPAVMPLMPRQAVAA